MIEIEWDMHLDERTRRRHPYHLKNSTVHGWVTKMRGTITGNERVRSRGIREMKAAAQDRRRQHRRKAEKGKGSPWSGILSLFRGSRGPKGPHHHRTRALVVKDIRYRSSDRRRKQPSSHHTPYHGHGTAIKGHTGRDKVRRATGKAMDVGSMEGQEGERKRRHKQQQKGGHTTRVDARGSRRR